MTEPLEELPSAVAKVLPSATRLPMTLSEIKESLKHMVPVVTSAPSLLIINDAHRATPSPIILDILLKIPDHQIKAIAIATGSHTPPSKAELMSLLNGINLNGIELIIHDGHLQEESYRNLGVTSRGTRVLVNPRLFDFEKIICINSVEPHYFAGFTGGIKSLIPGLASVKTIEKNHSWALSKDSGPTITDGNPLFEDLWECGSLIPDLDLFGIQLVNIHEKIFGVFSGSLLESFRHAETLSRTIFTHQIPEKFDMVIAHVVGPISRSLYQAQKGLENTRQAVKKGGVMVLLAECPKGIGNTAFFETIKKFSHPSEVVSSLKRETYRFGDHKAAKFASLAMATNLYICSSLSEKETNQVFASKISLQELREMIDDYVSSNRSVLYVYDAGNMVVTPQQ